MTTSKPASDEKSILIPKPPVTTLYVGGSGLDIAQVTDLHLAGHYLFKRPHLAALRRLLRHVNPKLVINTGDLFCKRRIFSSLPALRLFEEYVGREFPWTFAWGNHDLDMLRDGPYANHMYKKTELSLRNLRGSIYPSNHPFFAQRMDREWDISEPDDFLGGNFLIEVRRAVVDEIGEAGQFFGNPRIHGGSQESFQEPPVWHIFIFNSGKKKHLRPEVLEWAREQAAVYGCSVPAVAFFHRPVCAIREKLSTGQFEGPAMESVGCGGDDGYVHEMLSEIGTVKACFFGHDHVNNFHCNIDGIEYHYGRKTLSLSYGALPVRKRPSKETRTLPWGVTSIHLPFNGDDIEVSTILEDRTVSDRYEIALHQRKAYSALGT
jgi:hypothetical protein